MKHKIKISFKTKILWSAIIITMIPLLISYWIFIEAELTSMDTRVRTNLKSAALGITHTPLVQDQLAEGKNDLSLQYYTQGLIQNLEDVDIIVLADMTGEKYSHLDESQIGQIFEGEDKKDVLNKGSAYFSLNEGSMGETLRWFEPIYKGNKQVGFVMVGKYYTDIYQMNLITKRRYFILFAMSLAFCSIMAMIMAKHIKKAILDMEPEEIARLYMQKEFIINGVQEAIIALDHTYHIQEMNQNAVQLLEQIPLEALLEAFLEDIQQKKVVSYKEYRVAGRRIFASVQPIVNQKDYLGSIITLMDEQEIQRVAKELTGIEEINKNLRATIHEFKNNLHVILGLMQLEEYEKAKEYIMQLQETKQEQKILFATIEDHYIRALLLSRMVMASEKKIQLSLGAHAFLWHDHGPISMHDLVTVIGNLLENAFEACLESDVLEKRVEMYFMEETDYLMIKVADNGVPIPEELLAHLYEQGVSSKGEHRGNGLYLLHRIVVLYKGKIEIHQKESGGKEFIVILSKE